MDGASLRREIALDESCGVGSRSGNDVVYVSECNMEQRERVVGYQGWKRVDVEGKTFGMYLAIVRPLSK